MFLGHAGSAGSSHLRAFAPVVHPGVLFPSVWEGFRFAPQDSAQAAPFTVRPSPTLVHIAFPDPTYPLPTSLSFNMLSSYCLIYFTGHLWGYCKSLWTNNKKLGLVFWHMGCKDSILYGHQFAPRLLHFWSSLLLITQEKLRVLVDPAPTWEIQKFLSPGWSHCSHWEWTSEWKVFPSVSTSLCKPVL